MANFSTNQVRHFYAIGANASAAATVVKSSAAAVSAVGDVYVGKTADGTKMYFSYKGKGGLVRSDLIPINTITFAKSTPHALLIPARQKVTIALDSAINSGAPVAGQDYILHLTLRKLYNQSEDFDYIKVAAVRATTGMTASNFYRALALNLVKNFSRETFHAIDFYLTTASDPVQVTAASTETSLSGTYTGIEIREVDSDWHAGTFVEAHPEIVASFGSVTSGGVTYETWGTATNSTYTLSTDKSGRSVADLEIFCMGERGDQYRKMGWPNYVPTEYMIDPTADYEMVTIHYAFVDAGEGSQRSEKDIQFAGSKAAINALITKINTATGATSGNPIYIAALS